jgi:hypothetical protein
MVQLADDLLELIDAEAGRRGISRSALIREALRDYLAGSVDAAITTRIVEGYKKRPQATVDEWGGLAEQSARAAREVAKRLDAEERAAGLEPW